jgi:hypothetical protein
VRVDRDQVQKSDNFIKRSSSLLTLRSLVGGLRAIPMVPFVAQAMSGMGQSTNFFLKMGPMGL